MKRVFVVALLVTCGLVAATGDAWGKPLSEQQWRKKGEAACAAFKAERLALLPASGASILTTRNVAAAKQYVDQVVPLYERLMTSLERLGAPKARQKQVKAFTTSLADSIETIQADPLTAFAVFDFPFEKVYAAAKRLNLPSCLGLADQRL